MESKEAMRPLRQYFLMVLFVFHLTAIPLSSLHFEFQWLQYQLGSGLLNLYVHGV